MHKKIPEFFTHPTEHEKSFSVSEARAALRNIPLNAMPRGRRQILEWMIDFYEESAS